MDKGIDQIDKEIERLERLRKNLKERWGRLYYTMEMYEIEAQLRILYKVKEESGKEE